MDRPSWAPDEVDINQPSPSRMYDYFLGGAHNFAADRQLAERFIAAVPDTVAVAHDNRAFLRRAVRFLLDSGVRQFLDLGSGIPTVGNVHDLAQRAGLDTRVLYVDIDPVAVLHTRSMLVDNERASVIHADLRLPETILGHPEFGRMFDLDQPVAVLAVSVLHFVSEQDDPYRALGLLRDAVVPGSYLVVSHFCGDQQPADIARWYALSRRAGLSWMDRGRPLVERLFAGFDLVDPGLVWVPQWRPDADGPVDDPDVRRSIILAGVGRKP